MLRIFLYSLIIIGCFANFARNQWGFELRSLAELVLGITFLVDFSYATFKKDLTRTKADRVLMQIERFCIAVFFIAFIMKMMHWPGPGLMYVLSIGILVFILSFRMIGNYFRNSSFPFRKRIFWILFPVFFAIWEYIYFNALQYEFDGEAAPTIIFSSVFSYVTAVVMLILGLRLVEMIFERSKFSAGNFVTSLLLIDALVLAIGILFKTMHWPLGGFFIFFGCLTFLLAVILGMFIKTSGDEKSTLLSSLRKQYRNAHFLFFYFGVWSVYIFLAQLNVAPRFYSTRFPYEYEKLLEANDNENADKLLQNYEALIHEVDAKMDHESH